MRKWDDELPHRTFDNLQAVFFSDIEESCREVEGLNEFFDPIFAMHALQEIPQQYSLIKQLGLLGGDRPGPSTPARVLDPPDTFTRGPH